MEKGAAIGAPGVTTSALSSAALFQLLDATWRRAVDEGRVGAWAQPGMKAIGGSAAGLDIK